MIVVTLLNVSVNSKKKKKNVSSTIFCNAFKNSSKYIYI